MSTSKLSVFCDRLIEAGWLIIVIVTPLFFNSSTNRIMEADKLALVRTLASLMAAAWSIRWLVQQRNTSTSKTAARSPWVWLTLLVAGVYLLTTVAAIFPVQSLLGAYSRGQGMYGMLAYLAVFMLMLQGLRTRPQFDRLFVALILTSWPIALYGILQKIGLDPLVWNADVSNRVTATLGNPIFLGAYLIMVFFLTLSKVVDSWHTLRTTQIPSVRLAAKLSAILYGLIASAQVVALLFTDSRGPWVGWLLGLFVFTLLLALVLHARRLASRLLLAGLAAAAILTVLNLPNTFLEPIRSAPVIGRLFHIFEGESGTGQVRTQLWQADARLLLENPAIQFPDGTADPLHLIRPLIGYGLDSMPLVYNQLRLPEPALNNEDHSHNETWDVLLMTGLLGVLAYQVLYLSLFLYGLRYLGLLSNRRERNALIGLWAGGGALGVLIAIGIGQPKYMGLGLPLGNVLGLIVYLGTQILRRLPAEQGMNHSPTGKILAGAILASLLAHYVEAQFGLNLVTTQVMFWAFAGILIVLVRGQFDLAQRTPIASLTPQTPGSRRSVQLGNAVSYAFITVIILTTLLFEFVVFDNVDRAPLSLLWRSLTFSPTLGYATYAVLAVFVATWAGAVLLSVSEMARSSASATPQSRHWLKIAGIVATLSICLALVFAIGLCVQVSALPNVPLPVTDMQQPASLAQQLINITDYYLGGIVVLTLLTAVALAFEANARQLKWSSRWGWVTILPMTIVTFIWVNVVDLNPIRADVYYKVGRYFEDQNQWDVSIPLYARAIQLSPAADVYPMALGNVLQNRANASKPEPAVRFSDQTDFQEVLTLNEQQMIELKRLDFLYAAQTAFLHALDLNPLFPLHTLNLARFYTPELPIDSEAKTKLADLAGRYYAEATRLSPGNVLLWNEWAALDLDRQDPDAALVKIEESLRLVPSFDETYVTQGKIYSAKNDLERAAAAYRQAINLKPNGAEAYSRLAFIYYQQGHLAEAAESFLAYIDRAAGSPNLWEAHKNLALIYKNLGDDQQAIAHAQQAVSLAPTEAQAQLAELVTRLQPSATPTP